jgi:hypothetical protein
MTADAEPEESIDPLDITAPPQQSETPNQDAAVKQLLARQGAYRRFWEGKPVGDDLAIVRADLKAFCRGDVTPWDADPRVHALLTGRYEVYLRIMQHVTLSQDQLVEAYTRQPYQE